MENVFVGWANDEVAKFLTHCVKEIVQKLVDIGFYSKEFDVIGAPWNLSDYYEYNRKYDSIRSFAEKIYNQCQLNGIDFWEILKGFTQPCQRR